MRAESEPWLVPMRMARPSSLHLSTSGVNTSSMYSCSFRNSAIAASGKQGSRQAKTRLAEKANTHCHLGNNLRALGQYFRIFQLGGSPEWLCSCRNFA